MKPSDKIEKIFTQTDMQTNVDADNVVLSDAVRAMSKSKHRHTTRPFIKINKIAKFAAVVVFILSITGLHQLKISIRGTSVAWADVPKRFEKMHSYKAQAHRILTEAGQEEPFHRGEILRYFSPDYGSLEETYVDGELVMQVYCSLTTKSALVILPLDKLYYQFDLNEELLSLVEYMNPTDMDGIKEKFSTGRCTQLEPREIDGVAVKGLEVKDVKLFSQVPRYLLNPENINIRFWISDDTSLPVRIEGEGFVEKGLMTGFKDFEYQEVMYDIEYDADIDESIFKPNIPEDYRSIDPANIAEKAEFIMLGIIPLSIIIAACKHHKQKKENRRQQIASDLSMRSKIMKSNITKYAAAAMIFVGVFIGMSIFNSTPAWALEQTIEAMTEYTGAYLSGVCPGQTGSLVGFEMWLRINDADPSTKDILIITNDGIARWTQDNSTYTYIPAENTVYYEDAVTVGFSHFLGSEFFELLSSLKDTKIKYGYGPATGRKYAMLSGSITDVTGSKYLQTEFDVETKLATRLRQWENLPEPILTFDASNIRYFEQLPDSAFEVNIPAGAKYVEAPLIIPEANLKILKDAQHGISAEGLTKEQAGREIIEKLYKAVIEGDLEHIRHLAPVTQAFTDEFLKKVMHIGAENAIMAVLEIGSISKETTSPLGPVVIMPVTTQRKDGTVWRADCIIQFRDVDGKASCVVHGPHGLPVQLHE